MVRTIDITNLVMCCVCEEEFPGNEIVVSTAARNYEVHNLNTDFVYEDATGNVVCSKRPPRREFDDKVFRCPTCMTLHLFGFKGVPNLESPSKMY